MNWFFPEIIDPHESRMTWRPPTRVSGCRLTRLVAIVVSALIAIVPCFVSTSTRAADSTDEAKILFLHLRLKDGVVTLVKTTVRPGILKPHRGAPPRGELTFELHSVDGGLLANGTFNDPSVQRFEAPDPGDPSRMKFVETRVTDVEFVVRVAHHPAAKSVRFFRHSPMGTAVGKTVGTAPRLIGTVELPSFESPAR